MSASRTRHHASPWHRSLTAAALLGGAVYVGTLLALPLLDSHIDPLTAHPEDYASGMYWPMVNVSYLALALALAALGLSLMTSGRRRSILVLVLLAPPLLLCLALAVDPIGVARGNQLSLLPVFALAAAPIALAIAFRDRLRRWTGAFLVLGAAVLVVFVALVVVPATVGGAVNRAFDSLVGLWIIAMALAMRPT